MFNSKAFLDKNLLNKNKIKSIPTRNGYGDGLVEAGRRNKNLVVLCADLTDSTRSAAFKKEFPERFIECGIAEQNMVGVAAGLALSGKIPFVSSYAVFCPGVSWSQVRVLVGQNNANVKIAGSHGGVSVGADGMSHQALEDIAIMRCLPDMIVLAPCDAIETKKATLAAAEYKGPIYIRFARESTPVFTTSKTPFKIGKAEILRDGRDALIIACGPLVYNSLIVAEKLAKQGIEIEVINNHTIKPIDKETIIKAAKKTKAIVTVENHQIMGGMGSAIAEVLTTNLPANEQAPIEMVGVQDKWGESGEPEELIRHFGLDAESIIKAVKKVLKRKKSFNNDKKL